MLSVFQQFIGCNAIFYYAPKIFKDVGFEYQRIAVTNHHALCGQPDFTVVAIVTVEQLGRRPLQIIGALVMAVAMVALGITFALEIKGVLALFCVLLYIAGFAVSGDRWSGFF